MVGRSVYQLTGIVYGWTVKLMLMLQSVAIDKENAERFKRQVALPLYLTRTFQITSISIGCILAVISAGSLVWLRFNGRKQVREPYLGASVKTLFCFKRGNH